MNMKITRREILYFLCLIMAYSLTLFLKSSPPLTKINNEVSSIKFEPTALTYLTLGHERFFSKIIWIKTLIQSDTSRDFQNNSWMYYNFKSIKLLDPFFRSNYVFGSLYLSVVKSDIHGASELYKDGINVYPKDFHLNYYGAIHFLFEMQNSQTALELFNNIRNHPQAPYYLDSIIARIHAGNSDLTVAFELISDLYKKEKNDKLKQNFFDSLYSIKAEIDLNCLNSGSSTCNKFDLEQKEYLLRDGKYYAQKKWKSFRINKPNSYKKGKH